MLSSYTIVQLLTFSIYTILIMAVLLYARTKLKKLFMVFLLSSAGWSLVSLFANLRVPVEQAMVFGKMVPFFASWSVIAYAHFIAAYVHRKPGVVAGAGYAYLLFVAVLILLGYLPQSFVLMGEGPLYKDYGNWLYVLTAGGAVFTVAAIMLLVQGYRASTDPESRNRILYLLVGIGFLVVFGSVFEILPTQKYAVDHIGHLGNAVLITYSVLRYKLLDMKLVVRKGLVYAGITAFISAVFLGILYGVNYLLQASWPSSVGLAVTIGGVILMACLFNPLKVTMEKAAERLFYGNRYDYRKMVFNFASRMSSVIDIEELAEAMLRPIANAVSASQASLMFTSDGHFTSQYAERLGKREPVIPIEFRSDGPIVNWLEEENQPLYRETINIDPRFKGLWQKERNSLEAAEIESLCPIKSKRKLVAILALSKKQPRGYYSRDDTDMLMTLANEAAVAIDNAKLYERAKQRANTDELTGLYNHRYFHGRLDEEIARCSRFGDIFSLVFLDLDLFKKYNDVYGHLAGDEVLKQVGQHLYQSVRTIDISFRYGGDEFAVLLPGTSLKGAVKASERLRKAIEARTDWKGLPMTCSIGIASWPTDGVMREEIIQSADAALYYAKQVGRNQISLACEVALSDVLRLGTGMQGNNKDAILSTIYALAATVDAKDHHTYGHSKKVGKYASGIAEAMGYSREEMERIRAAALLHDIGKIGINDNILTKRESLTAEDWELIRAHPSLGVAILKHVDSLRDCLAAVQYHHERYDGTGYPAGLKGDNIPMDARIMAVADSYDAMTSERPYRPGKETAEQALAELKNCAGAQFDPKVVEAFVNLQKYHHRRTGNGKKQREKKKPMTTFTSDGNA